MQKLYRNIFAAGVISLGLAACGDDVTVTPPPAPPTPGVTSVTVSPANQTINVGQEVIFAAAVIADAGVTNTSVTWSSSEPTIASVEGATGKVKGLIPGTTTIVAKSNHDNSRVGVATVTVVSLPPGVTSFTAVPSAMTLLVGGTQTATVNAVYAPGVTAPAVVWSTLNGSVASVNSSTGVVTGQAPGSATIRATATLPADPSRGTPAQTVTSDINVTVAPAPSISINSVTQGAITVPVNVANVFGQIEINLNFNPREQPMDSVVVYIDQNGVPKTAAKQIFNGAIPAAGILTLSVNTANFAKNFTPGTTTVTFLNGQTTIRAAIWRTNPSGTGTSVGGPIAANCSVAPGSPICAAPIALVLNNMDGWAADWGTLSGAIANQAKPARFAQHANGLTYWGGPGATGVLTATLYSVIYTPGREISQVTWSVGTASTGNVCTPSAELLPGTPAVSTTRPWRRTFGYTAGAAATQNCSFREWTGGGLGDRDNVVVGVAIDNGSNPYVGALVPNTVVFGSTPDSLRLDHLGPTVGTPSIARVAPAVTGWVNAAFNFINFGSADFGVGLNAVRDRKVLYNVVGCPFGVAGAQAVAMPNGTGADIPECPPLQNSLGGTPGLGFPGTAPYNVFGTETDRLTNLGTSSVTSTFGVDKVVPLIRAGLASVSPSTLPAQPGADTVFRAAKPSVVVGAEHEFRAEYQDDRSGFYNMGQPDFGFPNISAQIHALSRAGHFNNAGICLVGTPPIGAAFVTAPACGLVSVTSVAQVLPRSDGWFAGQRVGIPALESYYGYTSQVIDQAGNASAVFFRKALVNTVMPFSTGLGIPATLTPTNFSIQGTYADSAEVTQQSLQLEYPNIPVVDSVRYSRNPVGLAFNDVISSPLAVTNDPKGCAPPQPTGACITLTPFARRIETTDATAFPASNVMAAGTPVNVKPTTARAWSWNHGSTLFTAPIPGTAAPAPAVSLLVAISPLNVQDGLDQAAYNVAAPSSALTHWRIIPTITTADQFGSTVSLRAQAASPSNTPNPPFVRVDFYRLQNNLTGTNPNAPFTGAGGQVASHWSYLGSAFGNVDACPTGTSGVSGAVCHTDQGTYRSWVYALAASGYAVDWSGQIQTTLVGAVVTGVLSGHRVIAVGITANGDGIVTQLTAMGP